MTMTMTITIVKDNTDESITYSVLSKCSTLSTISFISDSDSNNDADGPMTYSQLPEDDNNYQATDTNKVIGVERVVPYQDPLKLLCLAAASSPSLAPTTPNPYQQQTQTVTPPHTTIPTSMQTFIPTPHTTTPSNTPSHHPTTMQEFIDIFPLLDMSRIPRIDPITLRPIEILTSSTTIRESTKWAITSTILQTNYKDVSIRDQKEITKYISTYFSYVGGYASVVGDFFTFRTWLIDYVAARNEGRLEYVFKSKKKCSKIPYIDDFEEKFPGFLHECYRYGTSIAGCDAYLPTLLHLMEEYAKSNYPHCPTRKSLTMNKYHFRLFFTKFNGTYFAPTTKPRLNSDQIANRLKWAIKWKEWLRQPRHQRHCVFLDEKWFYISTKRRKIRKLPPHPLTETKEDAFTPQPKTTSRRFPTKVMFQGLVSRPYPEHGFNGSIMLKRCSKTKRSKKLSFNSKFSDFYHVTNLIKSGEWKYVVTCDELTTIEDVIDDMQYAYSLTEDVTNNLTFSYTTLNKNGNKKVVRFGQDDTNKYFLANRFVKQQDGSDRPLTINDLEVHVRVVRDSLLEEDITCDSSFMLDTVYEIGIAIRAAFHWVSQDDPIILFMDNAGGHGSKDTKKEFVSELKKWFNITVEWQVPNSPDTNLLDLGYWATLQAMVERMHRLKRMDPDVLAETVYEAFSLLDPVKIERVYQRWEYVLDLIIKGEGTNDLVEKNRGLTKSLDLLPCVKKGVM